MNLKGRIEIVPLVRTRPQCITVCRQLPFEELQNRLNVQLSYNTLATEANISHNCIEQLPNLPARMQVLTASHCLLRTIERVAGNQLLIVDLSGNRLTVVPVFESQVLHTLLLRDNLIQILEKSLLNYPLRRLEVARNRMRTFYVRVLKQPYLDDLELLQFVVVGRLSLALDSYQSLEDIMEQTFNRPAMMRKAIDLEYVVMLRYLVAVEPLLESDAEEHLAYAHRNGLNESLKELL